MSDTEFQVVVHNNVHSGYRRAGFVLEKGANLLMSVTAAQIEQLKADPRLVFGSQDPMPTESIEEAEQRLLSENHQDDSTQSSLVNGVLPADLTVEQLKAELNRRQIAFDGKAKKEALVQLLASALSAEEA